MGTDQSNEVVDVSISAVTGTSTWVSSDDGQLVYDVLRPALLVGKVVKLSFRGRDQVITAFLNVAIGQLLNGEFEADDLRRRLLFVDADQTDLAKVSLVMRNALSYFERRRVQNMEPSVPSM